MKLYVLTLFWLFGCSSPQHHTPPALQIDEINPNEFTTQTKKQLQLLNQALDLSPFLYTTHIQVQSMVIPHSHPVLTLNTRNASEAKKILAAFLHEEFHWWANRFPAPTLDRALNEFRRLYPILPEKGVAQDAHSTYLHLMVCWLEYKGTAHFLGNDIALKVIRDRLENGIYPWVYTKVIEDDADIARVLKAHKLIPKELKI